MSLEKDQMFFFEISPALKSPGNCAAVCECRPRMEGGRQPCEMDAPKPDWGARLSKTIPQGSITSDKLSSEQDRSTATRKMEQLEERMGIREGEIYITKGG